MQRFLPLAALALILAGCANTAPYSGDVYRSGQAQTAQTVSYGTITGLRQVQIQIEGRDAGYGGNLAGTAVGGMLGRQVGKGSGRNLATAAGAIAGGAAGSQIQHATNRTTAWEMQIQRDNGQEVVVVQRADRSFQVGQRVRLIGHGRHLSVAP